MLFWHVMMLAKFKSALWLFTAIGVLVLPATISSAASYTWTGAGSSDWFNTNNWSPAGVPGAGDTVTFASGTINLTAPVSFSGQFNWSGGNLMGNALTIASDGVMNISGNNTKNLWNALTNAGTVTWTNFGDLNVDYSSANNRFGFIENLPGALWDLQNNQTINNGFNNGAYFRNAGTVRKSASTGNSTISIPFLNTGTVNAQSGTIIFNEGAVMEGAFSAAAGTFITFNAGSFTYATPPTLTGPGTIRLNGGSLTLLDDAIANLQLLTGTVSLAPNFQGGSITNLTLLGGTLTGDNVVSGTFNWTGTLPGSLTVLDGGTVNWSGGTAQGPLMIASNGVMNISGNTSKVIRGALTNAGTVTWSGNGALQVDYSSADSYSGFIENLAGGLWDIQNNASIVNTFNNGAYFRNAGTVRKSVSTGNTTISIPFYNAGSVMALSGTLILNNDSIIEGSFDAAAGAAISFNTGIFTYSTPPTVTGAGIVRISGGTLTLADDIIPNLQLVSGTISLGPNFQGGSITNLTLLGSTLAGNNVVSGTFNWAGILPGSLTVLNGAVVNWSDGRVHGPITVASNGVLNISGDTIKFLWNALTNAGTVTWSGAADLRVDHSSSVTNYGVIYNLPGALWDIRNDRSILNSFPRGAFFQNAGTVRKSSGTGTSTISIPFFNTGTVTALSGTVMFSKGALIEGAFSAVAGATISFNAGAFSYATPPFVTGAGTVQLSGGNLTLANDTIPNLRLTGGVVSLGPNFQGGTITNLTMLGGTLTGNNVVSGTFDWAATLQGSLTLLDGATVTWSSGIAQGPVTIANNAVLNIAGNATKSLLNALTNAGTVTWSGGGDLEVNYSTTLNNYGLIENLASGVWDIQNDRALRNAYTFTAYFRNAGTVRKSAGTGLTTISIPFTNSGTAMVLQQTLAFTGGFAPAGGTMVAGLSGATTYGRFNIGGSAVLDGTLSVVWHEGFVGSISNTFTVVTYGSRTGTFSPVNLPPGAAWQVNYGPTALTVFVSGIRRLGITSPALGTTNAGAILRPVSVQVFDAATGAPLATNGLPVTIALASGNGTLSGTITRVTDSNGRTTFDDLSIDLVGAKTLSISAPGVTAATTALFNIIPAAPAQLGLVTSIGATQRNQGVFNSAPVVQVRDQFGNAVLNSTATITARLSSGGGGILGGTTVLNASGAASSAAFNNLVYALANPAAAESIVVYFTSPGLASVTNAPVFVNFVLGIVRLASGNSVVRINAASDDGVFSWTVDGVEQIHQQWFWLRRGATGPQFSLDALGPPIGVSVSSDAVTMNYQTNGLNVNLGFELTGGAIGSRASDLIQNLTIQNTSNGPVTLHVFQYADFDLAQEAAGDLVGFPATHTVAQQGKNAIMTQTAAPPPTYREASHYAITLQKIVGAAAATLSNQIIPPSPGDQTYANQWQVTLPAGQTLAINLANVIRQSALAPAIPPGLPVMLTIERQADEVLVSWPSEGAMGFLLEQGAACDSAAAWSAVTNAVNVSGEFYHVTLPATEAARFYRLKR